MRIFRRAQPIQMQVRYVSGVAIEWAGDPDRDRCRADGK